MKEFSFEINQEKYGEALAWKKSIRNGERKGFSLNDEIDCKNWNLIDELKKEREQAEINWLKQNKEHLYFDSEFKDVGYAFVDILTIYDENNNEIYQTSFMGEGESEEFIAMIMQDVA